MIYWIDLFAGAGGTSTGIHLAGQKVIACVNHDHFAIEAHKSNHPDTLHYEEDIRDFAVIQKLKHQVELVKSNDPNAIIAIWASLECTNFSKAKGGLPRDADSRTLAHHMLNYLIEINPEYFWVENVREFMAWGPLDENGKPKSKNAGIDYLKWVQDIKELGYVYDYQLLNSANYGSYQSRERLFIQFAKPGYPINWPEQTHAKAGAKNQMFEFKRWKAVRAVLDLEDRGKSIFSKKYADKTLERIYNGLWKFVANQKQPKVDPFIDFIQTFYGNGQVLTIDSASPTLTTKDRIAKVNVQFIDLQYGNGTPMPIDRPVATLTNTPKLNLASVEVSNHFLINPSWFGHGNSVDLPSPTIIARQDKAPLYLMSTENGSVAIEVSKDDSEIMVKIKCFMVAFGISDIKLRMLNIQELLRIQGFPGGYQLKGNQAQQKKQIGNAVDVSMSKALAEAFQKAINSLCKSA